VETDAGALAGAWGDVVAAAAGVAPVRLQPLRRSAAILPAPDGHDVAGWPLFGGITDDWYAKPTGGKLLDPGVVDSLSPARLDRRSPPASA